MQKTYWWRVVVLFLGAVAFGWGYLVVNAIQLGLCSLGQKCFFHYNSYVDPLMFISLFLLVVSSLLFFVYDVVFIKWLKFVLVWFALAAIFILLAPVYSGGYIGLNPTKESVSIWMGSIFVVVSIFMLAYQHIQLRKK